MRRAGRGVAPALLADDRDAERIADDATDRVLDGEIGRGHHVAIALEPDLPGADPAPSDPEPTSHRFDRDQDLRPERNLGSGHLAFASRTGVTRVSSARPAGDATEQPFSAAGFGESRP